MRKSIYLKTAILGFLVAFLFFEKNNNYNFDWANPIMRIYYYIFHENGNGFIIFLIPACLVLTLHIGFQVFDNYQQLKD